MTREFYRSRRCRKIKVGGLSASRRSNLVEPLYSVGVLGSDAPGCSAFRVEILETLLGFFMAGCIESVAEDLR